MRETYSVFVIIPFDEKFDEVFVKGIKPIYNKIPGVDLIVSKANEKLKGLDFVRHIHQHMHDTNFCIADITDHNPNVLYEIGFAQAIEKKVIIIRKEGVKIPVDLSDRYIIDYKEDNLEMLCQNIESALYQTIKDYKNSTIIPKDHYSVDCYRDRKVADIGSSFKNAKIRIDILQTNLTTIYKNYINDVISALDNNSQLIVRILALDPESFYVAKRAEQLGIPTGHYREELHENIRHIIKKLGKYRDQFFLKIYDNFPTQITFIIDGFVYMGSIAMNYRSRELCTFKLKKYDLGVEKSFVFHFDSIWALATQYEPGGHLIRERLHH